MRLTPKLALCTVFAFGVALTLQAAFDARSVPGPGFTALLVRNHGFGIAVGLAGGALPFLVALGVLGERERRHRVKDDARARHAAAIRIADAEELSDANRLVSMGTLASMAHELGTPLGVVQARAQMIAGGEATGAELQKDIGIILDQTRRMTQMVREVLERARRKTAFDSPVDLVALSRQALGMLEAAAQQRNVRILLVDTGVPAVARGDASKLLQILTNLGANARDSMPGGGTITFTTGCRRASPPLAQVQLALDYLFVDVRDEGAGVAAQHLPHLFDTFFTTKEAGSGLGLSVSYRIATEHGGWIGAESEPGVGSCFTLFLPRAGG